MKCYQCGAEMIWGCDFMYEDYGIEGEGIVSEFSCSECNCSCSFYMPFEEEEENGN